MGANLGSRVWGRRLVVLMLLGVPAAAAGQSPLERAAGLTVVDEPLEAALRQLQRSSGISLVFSPDLLPGDSRVTCSCAEVTVAQALTRLLAGTGLDFVARGGLVTIMSASGRERKPPPGAVTGLVLDREGGSPIGNALVELGEDRRTLSSPTGSFHFGPVPPGAYAIRVTTMGWKQETSEAASVAPGDTVRIRIVMSREAIPLEEIVIQPGTFGLLEDVTPGTARTLTRAEIRSVPQLGEDVFRAVKQLPGVASGDISTRLRIRGGADREILVRLDGLELYEPYHVKDWEGALGIVDLNLLGGVEMESGGFGAQYGDRMTGVLDMTSRTPEGGTATTLGLSISSANFMMRGTFGDRRGTWLLSARRGFLDLIMGLANEGRRLSPTYHDIFGKVSYELGSWNRVSGRFLASGDRFLLRDPEVADLDAVDFESEWDSRYGWVTWEAFPGSRLSVSTLGWVGELGRDRAGFVENADDTPFRISARDHRDMSFFGVRSELNLQLTDRAALRLGGEGKALEAGYDYLHRTWSPYATEQNTRGIREDTLAVVESPSGHQLGAYAAFRLRLTDRLTGEAGLRLDAGSQAEDRDLSPRILAAYALSPRTNLRASYGLYAQSHGFHELSVGDGETAFLPSETARQLSLGLDHKGPAGFGLRVELYRRAMEDLRPVYFNAEQEVKVFPEASGDRLRLDPDRGRALGLELLVEGQVGLHWTWSGSYVLAIAEDRVEDTWIPRQFDQRHTAVLQAAYRPDPRWSFSLGWRLHTGWPATAWSWDVRTLDDGWNLWTQEFGPIRGTRLPAYHRLDLRATRTLELGGGRLQVYLDLFNVYNRTNLGSWDYSGSYENGILAVERVNGQEMLPFLPTFGFWYEF